MKKIFIFSVLLLTSLAVFSQSAGSQDSRLNPLITSAPSLTITPDARAGGMGDVGVATSADVNSQHWNPSKYVFMDSPGGVSFSYTPWMSKIVKDINLAYLCGYFKIADKQVISGSLRYFSLGQVDLTNADGTVLTSTQPSEFAIDAAYSRLLSERWSAAVAMRFIYADLSGGMVEELFPGNSVAADIATTYKMPLTFPADNGSLAFGLNISNIGSKISYDKGNTNLFIPTNMRLGASLEYPMDKYNKISVSLDLNKMLIPSTPIKNVVAGADSATTAANDKAYQTALNKYNSTSPLSGIFNSFSDGFAEEMREIAWAVGVEYAYNKQFFLRGGYFNEDKTKGSRKYFTAGAGFKLNMFQLDASYVISVAQTNPLDQTIRFSLSFDMEGLKDLAK